MTTGVQENLMEKKYHTHELKKNKTIKQRESNKVQRVGNGRGGGGTLGRNTVDVRTIR